LHLRDSGLEPAERCGSVLGRVLDRLHDQALALISSGSLDGTIDLHD
jgi:hypothetical protein